MLLKKAITASTYHMKELYELAGGVVHDGEKGAFREYFVSELIKPCVPEHFGVGSGIVADAYGKQSRQCDVIIYDKRLLPPILRAGEKGLYPIDSVLSVLEVKSILKACHYTTLVDAAHLLHPDNKNGLKIATPGKLENNYMYYPLYAVFGYTSDAKEKSEFERLQKQCPSKSHLIKLIGVLDKGVWSKKDGGMLSDRIEENTINFLCSFLNQIEVTAKSRGDYRLQDWL